MLTIDVGNVCTFKLLFLNFDRFEVVSRNRDPQSKLDENQSYLLNLGENITKSWCFSIYRTFNLIIKSIANDIVVLSA